MSTVISFTSTKRAAKVDFNLEENSDLDFPVTLQNPDGTERLVTNWGAKMQIRDYADAASVLLELSTDNGKISTVDGKVTLKFSKEDFPPDLQWKSGVYDLKIISPAGKDEYIMEGNFAVDQMVTR